ncbi:hypothetical protein EJB05_22852 [Eragrostis curvula]|uniref:CASP-like protein n=1 Tax=Eragrostis curvula TaxID=38414 RepID=A0A5J9V6X7_9POAL|nr:hypothetical protein EJB05_22852 [Eragrostis curvula]
MAAGHPAVHPMGINAPAPLQQEGPVAELDFFPEIAGKTRGMILRFLQFIFAGIGACLAALSSEIKTTQFNGAMGVVDMVMVDMKRSLKKKWALGLLVFFDTVS